MAAVQTWTDVAPSSMNSTASRQLAMPPMPEMGIATALATDETMCSAMGLTAGPQYPPWLPRPATAGRGAYVSRSTPTRLLKVLTRETASAPPAWAARAMWAMSVTLGVSFTITGVRATSFTQDVIMVEYSGTC